MVLRKSDDQEALVPAPLSKTNPPYPTSPLEAHPPALPSTPEKPVYAENANKSPAFHLKTPEETKLPADKQDIDSDLSDDEWGRSDDDDDFEDLDPYDVPAALKPAGGKPPPASANKNTLPDALRAGPPAGVPIKRSMENISPMPTGASSVSVGAMSSVSEHSNGSIPLQTNNPYLKIQTTGQSTWGGESSQSVWGDSQEHSQKQAEPVELPAYQTPTIPTRAMHDLQLGSSFPPTQSSKPSDQPPHIALNSATPRSEHPRDFVVANPWEQTADASANKVAPQNHELSTYSQNAVDRQPWQREQDWGLNEIGRGQNEVHGSQAAAVNTEQQRRANEDLHRVGQTPLATTFNTQPTPSHVDEQPPALPPRTSHEEHLPAMPPRPIDTGAGSSTALGPESPNTTMNRQRKEHYQIKHIRWHDYNKQGLRTSPVLTQNLNGPCPLLALVNALVLSTPPGIETALIETLRTRETVSLGLLLDAVFDELMSGRRGDAAQALPDVSELYKFLLALHTGLNVNPLFVPDASAASGIAALTNRAGGFENTRDMKLYRTFDVPLMHGWLPDAGSEVYAAFDRAAKSYETSQYVQFQEEELDAKLQMGESLTADEQQMFTDIHAIKEFLGRWPTQLTDHGLKVIRDNLQRGQVAILFRNDHFSTLYKDPRTDQLVTLVTDQGYSSHDEIVWESLVDVNGQGSQLFSGDFRSVDNSSTPARAQEQEQDFLNANDNQGWTTVQGRQGNQQQPSQAIAQDPEVTPSGGLSRAEQEDHDLALALQLQEEEEDRERRANEQRSRDNQASVNAIAAQSQPRPSGPDTRRAEQAPVIPPRRNNITTHRPNNEPAPPPTYEEASTSPRYNPPPGHPASAQAPLQGAYQGSSSGLPLPPSNSGGRRYSGRPMQQPSMVGRPGRRQSAGANPNGEQEREKCVVM